MDINGFLDSLKGGSMIDTIGDINKIRDAVTSLVTGIPSKSPDEGMDDALDAVRLVDEMESRYRDISMSWALRCRDAWDKARALEDALKHLGKQ